MNTNKVILRTAIVTALGFALPNYAAAAYLEIGSPIKLATEIPVVDGDEVVFGNGVGVQIDMSAMAGRAISDTSPLEVRLTLTNGAKFSTTNMANIGCDYSAASTVAAASNPAAISMLNGAAGDTTVTFKLKDGNIAGTSPKCNVSGFNIKMYGGQKAYTMIATAYLKSNAEPVVINTSGPIIDFTQAYGINIDTKTVTVDVTSPSLSQKFAGGAVIVELGTVGYTAMNAAVRREGTPALAKDYVLSTLKIALSGAPLNVTNGLVLAISGTDPLGCTAATGPTAKTATVASGVTFDFGGTTAGAGVRFCLKTDGANRIDKGKVNIDLTAVGGNGNAPNVTISSPLLTTVNKNGASIKVLNIPNPTSIDKTFVRIYNLSGAKTSVYGTLYEQSDGTTAGKELGKGKLLGEIDVGAVKILDATGIAAIFGVSTWVGKAWLQIEGDSQQIRVQSLIRSAGATGPLIDMSDRVLEDGRALCRSDTTCN
jgi:hypothetical protein